MKQVLDVIAVKPTNYFSNTTTVLEDLAVAINQAPIQMDKDLIHLSLSDLVVVDQIKITKTKTTIIHESNDQTKYNQYLQALTAQKSQYQPHQAEWSELEDRIARLQAKVGVIKIGGQTEVEQQEKQYRIEDALNATQHAVNAGVIPGAGMGLFYVGQQMLMGEAIDLGTKILAHALQAPALTIIANAGTSFNPTTNQTAKLEPEILKAFLAKQAVWTYYDPMTGLVNDAWSQGIIDPAQVAKTVLKKAVSISATLITTEAVVVDEPEKTRFVFPDMP